MRSLSIHQLEEALGVDDSYNYVAALEAEVTLLRRSTMIVAPALWALVLGAAELSNYRGFQFGTTLEVAAKQAGAQPSGAKLVHQRPAVIQADMVDAISLTYGTAKKPAVEIQLSLARTDRSGIGKSKR